MHEDSRTVIYDLARYAAETCVKLAKGLRYPISETALEFQTVFLSNICSGQGLLTESDSMHLLQPASTPSAKNTTQKRLDKSTRIPVSRKERVLKRKETQDVIHSLGFNNLTELAQSLLRDGPLDVRDFRSKFSSTARCSGRAADSARDRAIRSGQITRKDKMLSLPEQGEAA